MLEKLKSNCFYFNYVVVVTIIIGTYLHVSVLFLGHELVIKHIFTPAFDMILAIPMVYSAIGMIAFWRRVALRNLWQKIFYGFSVVYFVGSVPLHVQTYFTSDLSYVAWFPVWYSAVLMPLFAYFIYFFWNLEFK